MGDRHGPRSRRRGRHRSLLRLFTAERGFHVAPARSQLGRRTEEEKVEGWRRESHGGERGQHILDCFHAGAVTTLSVAA
jgi:hypothetical protein